MSDAHGWLVARLAAWDEFERTRRGHEDAARRFREVMATCPGGCQAGCLMEDFLDQPVKGAGCSHPSRFFTLGDNPSTTVRPYCALCCANGMKIDLEKANAVIQILTAEGDSLRGMLAKGQRPHCRHCYGTGKRPVLTAEWHKGITQTSEPCWCGADVAVSEAAERLLTLIYLYPNYRVDSRGPSGLIVDALEVLAPDLAARLREGEPPEAILSALAARRGA